MAPSGGGGGLVVTTASGAMYPGGPIRKWRKPHREQHPVVRPPFGVRADEQPRRGGGQARGAGPGRVVRPHAHLARAGAPGPQQGLLGHLVTRVRVPGLGIDINRVGTLLRLAFASNADVSR